MNRRNFLKLFLTTPLLMLRIKQSDELSIDELEVLAEEKGGRWLDRYLWRIK